MTPDRSASEALVGTWRLLRCEAPLEIQPGTTMRFGADGTLDYVIPTGDGVLRVALRWRLDAGTLHTMHEDGSNPVTVAASIGEADVLAFDFGGPRAFFVRST
ncbi:MAG: hypothetical protein V4813_09745 [Gemmatimonadota bacterium]